MDNWAYNSHPDADGNDGQQSDGRAKGSHYPGSPSATADRQSSPSGSLSAWIAGPEYAIPGRHGYLTPEGPVQFGYHGQSARNRERTAEYNRQSREVYENWDAIAPLPLVLSPEPTPAPSPAPYGGHLSPQWTHGGSASAYAHSTTDSGSESVYPRSTTHSRSGSGSPHARSATHSSTESPSASSAIYSSPASPAYAGSAYYSDSASLYAGSATTSRASSAGLTPEPEQRFQCPDCSYDFGSREILNMHLAGQYRVGHCHGPH